MRRRSTVTVTVAAAGSRRKRITRDVGVRVSAWVRSRPFFYKINAQT